MGGSFSTALATAKARRPLWIWLSAALVTVLTVAMVFFSLRPPAAHASAGDWTSYMNGYARSGYNPDETTITQATAPNLTMHWQYTSGGHVFSQPIVANGLIYWGAYDGFEYANHLDGTLAWKTFIGRTTSTTTGCTTKTGVVSTATITTVTINGTPTLVDIVGGGDAQVYALDAQTGAIIWQTRLGPSPSYFAWASPAVYQGSVYFGLASLNDCPLIQGGLVQLDAATGTLLHSFFTVPDGCLGGSVWGSVAIDDATGKVYFGTGNPGTCGAAEPLAEAFVEVNASDLSFVDSWQVPQIPKDLDFGTTPTLFTATIGGVQRSLVGAVNKNGTYYAFDRGNIGAGPVWKTRISHSGSPALGSISPASWDGTYIYDGGGNAIINGVSCTGTLNALNPATGAFVWRLCTSGAVVGAITTVPGVAVAGSVGGTLYVVATTGTLAGQVLFSHTETATKPYYYGASTISGGVLYAVNWDRNLQAFGL